MKMLEIGPSIHGKIGPEWETWGMGVGDRKVDVTGPLPVTAPAYDLIYMSHVMEHIPWTDTVAVLTKLRGILIPGGTMEVWVPDFDAIIQAGDGMDWEGEMPPNEHHMAWVNFKVFNKGKRRDSWHHAAFNQSYLWTCLELAGFSDICKLTTPRGKTHAYNLGLAGINLRQHGNPQN